MGLLGHSVGAALGFHASDDVTDASGALWRPRSHGAVDDAGCEGGAVCGKRGDDGRGLRGWQHEVIEPVFDEGEGSKASGLVGVVARSVWVQLQGELTPGDSCTSLEGGKEAGSLLAREVSEAFEVGARDAEVSEQDFGFSVHAKRGAQGR